MYVILPKEIQKCLNSYSVSYNPNNLVHKSFLIFPPALFFFYLFQYKPYCQFRCPCYFRQFRIIKIVVSLFSQIFWGEDEFSMIRCSAVHKETVKQKAQIKKEFSLVAQVSMFFSDLDKCWFLMKIMIFHCIFQSVENFLCFQIKRGSAFLHPCLTLSLLNLSQDQ